MYEIYTTTSQTYTQNQPIIFTTPRSVDCRIRNNGNTSFTIGAPGVYVLTFHGVASSGTAGGQFTVQLYRNGAAVPGVVTTITSTAVGDAQTLSAQTMVSILPSCASINNATSLQWVVTSADAGTVTSANFTIFRLK